jgi:fluoride exporter
VTWFLLAVGGLVGAPCRYLVDTAISGTTRGARLPWGTIAINICGGALLGVIAATTARDGAAYALVGTGFCGAFTTFSAFTWETFALVEDGLPIAGVLNVVVSLVFGLAATALCFRLA